MAEIIKNIKVNSDNYELYGNSDNVVYYAPIDDMNFLGDYSLTEAITFANEYVDGIKTPTVQNNLTYNTSNTTNVLSAYQGKVLNDKINNIGTQYILIHLKPGVNSTSSSTSYSVAAGGHSWYYPRDTAAYDAINNSTILSTTNSSTTAAWFPKVNGNFLISLQLYVPDCSSFSGSAPRIQIWRSTDQEGGFPTSSYAAWQTIATLEKQDQYMGNFTWAGPLRTNQRYVITFSNNSSSSISGVTNSYTSRMKIINLTPII